MNNVEYIFTIILDENREVVAIKEDGGFLMEHDYLNELTQRIKQYKKKFSRKIIEQHNSQINETTQPRFEYSGKSIQNGRVYVMFNTRSKEYKIGFTIKDPTTREKQFKMVDPAVQYLFSIDGTKRLEHSLHNRFKNKRIRGEWFNLCLKDLLYIKGIAEKIYEPTT